jgi:voltage-dependent calcium channel L type alpha-1D
MLIGMELFGFKLDEQLFDSMNEYGTFQRSFIHRSTFNTILEAFLSTFIILANDGWTRLYFEHYRSTSGLASTAYFLTVIIVGQFILMNLFISVLIENFE